MKQLLLLLTVLFGIELHAQSDLAFYFPNTSFNPDIQTPEEFTGHKYGEWHLEHTQIVSYLKYLDEKSNRITLETYGYSYEKRPILLLNISSETNQKNIETLKKEHQQLSQPKKSKNLDLNNMPIVVWMGYSVHGNEPSGGNSAVLIAYYFAAAQDELVEEILKNTIVLLDPVINPDGFSRAAHWSNSNTHYTQNTDISDRQWTEGWPAGRTNHYWFDLNRDWLPLQHPESQGRIKKFHEWKPNIVTDHHEMGVNATFFFQPGVPARNNHLTPKENFELTKKIGSYHAKALDKIGTYYFSEETFDDFNYGKGSSYPDANGSIGILFEQARLMGQIARTDNGILRFMDGIKNQTTVTFSTLKAARENRIEILNYQRNFYKRTAQLAKSDPIKAYVFGEKHDTYKNKQFIKMLMAHKIEICTLKKDIKIKDKTIKKENGYLVSLNQNQYRLIKSIFEQNTAFQDSLFYDISAWTFPLAFDLDFKPLQSIKEISEYKGNAVTKTPQQQGQFVDTESAVAYIIRWDNYLAPKLAYKLLDKGLRVKAALLPFDALVNNKSKKFSYGSIMIPTQNQKKSVAEIKTLLKQLAKENGVNIYGISTSYTSQGIDMGSRWFQNVKKPKVLMLTGNGIRSSCAGEIWHLFDQRFDIPITMVDQNRLGRVNLQNYNVLMVPNGRININKANTDKIKSWIQNGGTLIALKAANKWLKSAEIIDYKIKEKDPIDDFATHYDQVRNKNGAQHIGGSIFSAFVDHTHPIGWGYNNSELAVFKNDTQLVERNSNLSKTPVFLTENSLLAGYISADKKSEIDSTACILINKKGKGKIVSFFIDPNYRAFWYGTNRLFMNAVFFGNLMEVY
ncbi:MAG: M14 family zinc carboxypeptidase [Bacteroidota bacterium]